MNTFFVCSRVSLPKIIDDHRIAVVFALDYLLGTKSNDSPITNSQSVIICWGAWKPFVDRSQLAVNGRIQASVSLIGGPRPNPEESLCYKNLLHLYRRDDSVFTESTPKMTIQFSFNIDDPVRQNNFLNNIKFKRHLDSISGRIMPTYEHDTSTFNQDLTETIEKCHELKEQFKITKQETEINQGTNREEKLPPILIKKKIGISSNEIHQSIERAIIQESPRDNVLATFEFPWKETKITNLPRSVYSTLSNAKAFVRIPNNIINFNVLLLVDGNNSSEPSILKRLDSNGKEVTDQGVGLMAKFLIDRQSSRNTNGDEFLSFLQWNSIAIEVWDAESLIHLGTSYIPLKANKHFHFTKINRIYLFQHLIRGGLEAVQCTVQSPIVSTSLPGECKTISLLYLRIANIGHPSSNQIGQLFSLNFIRN
uniref:NPHP4 C2-like domain-containing protein n=1 Tax=Heterorhabditis bacteriophora TaxID=37862 RepID=A0A1I7X3A2_HETBA